MNERSDFHNDRAGLRRILYGCATCRADMTVALLERKHFPPDVFYKPLSNHSHRLVRYAVPNFDVIFTNSGRDLAFILRMLGPGAPLP